MTDKQVVGDRFKIFLMGLRQCVIMFLGLLEDYLEVPRSIIPRRKRNTIKQISLREKVLTK